MQNRTKTVTEHSYGLLGISFNRPASGSAEWDYVTLVRVPFPAPHVPVVQLVAVEHIGRRGSRVAEFAA